ncbi:hypothetical protein SAMN04488581_2863 [Mycolicibacterium neoaurum]|uniref:hypothetical protein n=1 Tax=Mycolicibacterium neoaurum TaxID=1795 RepID=UPI00056B3208|nr:hypothetical protein [Mycolicibacterium neoaurum]SDD84321.1 hypothetical protein SAMN04488581_2863 [Mycolicibacterium neoaurum]
MSTLDFVSASADGIADAGVPLVTAPTLISGLGSHPALTAPLVVGRPPATALIWRRLAAVADFYGTDMPAEDALNDALDGLLDRVDAGAVIAAEVLVVPIHGRTQFLVSGATITPHRDDRVALDVRPHRPVPQWRRIAVDTTSRAADDLAARELAATGYVDVADVVGDRIGRPQLGALIFDTERGRIGTGVDVLDLSIAAGLVADMPRTDEPIDVGNAVAAQFVSPRFEIHPVTAIGARRFEVNV